MYSENFEDHHQTSQGKNKLHNLVAAIPITSSTSEQEEEIVNTNSVI